MLNSHNYPMNNIKKKHLKKKSMIPKTRPGKLLPSSNSAAAATAGGELRTKAW